MVAVDALGGDSAPLEICRGAVIAAKQGVPLMLFGPQDRIESILERIDPLWRAYGIQVTNAPDEVLMGEEPVSAIRKKPNSSLVSAVLSVKSGICQSVISAGSSGGLVAAATLILGRIAGVDRPCIAGFLPSASGKLVIALDLGAVVECRPQHLYQFAHLGVAYAEQVLGIKEARVGLLSNGSEDSKGNSLTKEVFQLLKKSALRFVGNIEPEAIAQHQVDVLVCDGFSGNILLKTMEATVEAFLQTITARLQSTAQEEVLAAQLILKQLQSSPMMMAPGGAHLLGVAGTVVVAHGNSIGEMIAKGIVLAHATAQARGSEQFIDLACEVLHESDVVAKG